MNYKNDRKANNTAKNNYVGAPYNFVSLNNRVLKAYNNIGELPSHNEINDEYLSGEIKYTIKALSPVFISNGKKEKEADFFKNVNGEYAIPGSTVRGLIRSNTQILGLGAIGGDIDNNTFMYRGLSKGVLKSKYNEILGVKPVQAHTSNESKTISVAKNVKTGYIAKENNKYYLYKTKVDNINDNLGKMNYYPFQKARGLEDVLPPDNKKPFFLKINYEIKGERRVESVSNYDDKNAERQGYIVRSGYMYGKKTMYIIPEIDISNKSEIPEEDILSFKHDYELKEKQLRGYESYYSLPVKDIKPVFYIEYNGRFYFGFTPYLRLFYDYSINNGIPEAHKDATIIDFTKSMFGFSNDILSYKSRIFFEDALLIGNPKFSEPKEYILATPKPSSYMDYLKQRNDNKIYTYNIEDFKIRGIKQYWFKNKIVKSELKKSKLTSTIRPIDIGSVYKGIIRFKNLTKIELGLLLWSIKLESNCNQNIGMAKAYGYGKININVDNLSVYDYEKMYSLDRLCLEPYKDETSNINLYIEQYKSYLESNIGREAIEISSIKDFITMKSITPKDELTRYMNVIEYQYRKKSLQDVSSFNNNEQKVIEKDTVDINEDTMADMMLKLHNKYNKYKKD